MSMRALAAAAAGLAMLAGCAAQSGEAAQAAFDPAACYERDFSIYFEGNSTRLSDDARQVLNLQGDQLRGCRIDRVRVIGLADDAEGTPEAARQISAERAEVLRDYLAQRLSWPRTRIELLATGERGAVTADGLQVPVRTRAHIIVAAAAP